MLIIKIGGGKDINWDYVCADAAILAKKEEIILVHGASARRDEIAEGLVAPTRYILSPSGHRGVYTDKKALEILTMVYAGLANKEIVARLRKFGVNAVGLAGVDAGLWQGSRKKILYGVENGKTKIIKDTFTGKVEKINVDFIRLLTRHGYVPVITQPAISYEAELINTDNDRNIAVMAKELAVKRLVVLFAAHGFLRDFHDENSLIRRINRDEIDDFINKAEGRIRKKLLGAKEALEGGARAVYWGDGRIKNPIRSALSGNGTIIL
ncbi:MAG: [LysW]-aminoadipate kinase [Candidatus Magasanikbacteria bacterium]|nr:[LysW]-aminoadipate kinase [Candidatus Magasanikbacteria bacterium]